MTQTLVTTEHNALLAPQVDFILVDGSGSMKPKWWDFMASLDAFIDVLKAANLNSHIIASVFDSHDIGFIQRDQLLCTWQPLHEKPLVAYWGGTPLYDAINHMCRHLRDLNPSRASIVIVTDGEATHSQYTDATQAKALLDWCRAKGWSVTFIGCDFNNSSEASLLGISDSNSIGVAQGLLTDAAKNLGAKRTRHYHGADSMNFSDDEKQQFGGYLAASPQTPKPKA